MSNPPSRQTRERQSQNRKQQFHNEFIMSGVVLTIARNVNHPVYSINLGNLPSPNALQSSFTPA
jgi:hypothetical protein